MKIAFRPAQSIDRQFIVSGWSASYRTSHSAGMIMMSEWPAVMHRQIDLVLARERTKVIVAFDSDDPTNPDGTPNNFGFIVAEPDSHPPLVIYCYVRAPHRKSGIARALFKQMRIDPEGRFRYGCKTAIVRELERKIPYARPDLLSVRFENPIPENDNVTATERRPQARRER